MHRDDDDLDGPSLSETHALERGDHRKGERIEKRRKQKSDLQKLKRTVLMTNLPTPNQAVRDDDANTGTFGTKSTAQEVKEQTSSIDMKSKTDPMIEQQKQGDAARNATPYEQQDEEG